MRFTPHDNLGFANIGHVGVGAGVVAVVADGTVVGAGVADVA